MAFPATILPIKQELLINGTWTDITSDTRGSGGTSGVQITGGYSGEQYNLSAGYAQFTLNNRSGKYTNRNPTSPYYRLLGRNTQYRTGYDTGVVSARFLNAASTGTTLYDGSVAYMADAAGIDITGDIDICVDFDADDWNGRLGHVLTAKYQISGNQRSWAFVSTNTGYLQFIWSVDGTSTNRILATCPVQVSPTGRVQYRVQLDVNNGSGGWTCSFYQGSGTITGTYTLIGSTSGTGTTSIFSSSARLEVGDGNNGSSWGGTFTDANPFSGKFYGMLLRNGINGTGVAAFRADLQTAGTTTWVDSVGNTWNLAGSAYFSSIDYRFWGEVPSLPNRWDTSGTDIYIPVRAADVVQRLTTGKNTKPLRSAVYRNLSQFAWDGYWPMEQAFDAQNIAATIGQNGVKKNADFSVQPSDFPGTAGSLIFNDDTGTASASALATSGTPTTTTYLFYFKFDTALASATFVPFMQFYPQSGSAAKITFLASSTAYQAIITDSSGTQLALGNPGNFGGLGYVSTEWTAMRMKLSSSGGTITWEWAWYPVNGVSPVGLSGTYSGTLGRPLSWRSEAFTGKFGLELAHVAMGRFDFDFISSDFIDSTNAFTGESWYDRARRLGAEESFPIFIEGPQSISSDTSFVTLMGPQGLKTFTDHLLEVAAVAGGLLYASRDKYGLTIRSWEQLVNQGGPQLDYSLNHLSGDLQPEPDDFLIENDVTLTMADGSSFRYEKTTGTLNTGDPASSADAVGTYDVADTINLYDPNDLEQFTRRRVLFGTWDEARYPQVQVQLERAPFTTSATLTAFCRKTDLGRPISIINPPSWLPPGPIDLMVAGYVETMAQFTHTINWNTRPGGPWKTGEWGSSTAAVTSIWGAASTTLKTGVNSTATSLTFETTDRFETWSTTATGYQVEIAGERMTINSVGARTGTGPYDYAVTVTRSANGIVKSLSAGEAVTVVQQGRWS